MATKYDKEFKLQTVRLIKEEGKTVAQVAREMGLHENTLYRWMAEFKNGGVHAFPGRGHSKPEDKTLRDLQKRIRYEWTQRKESNRKKRREKLERRVRNVFYDSRQLYGSPRVWHALKQQGVRGSQKTVARIMKELGRSIMDERMTKELCLKALDQAYRYQKPRGTYFIIPIGVASTRLIITNSN